MPPPNVPAWRRLMPPDIVVAVLGTLVVLVPLFYIFDSWMWTLRHPPGTHAHAHAAADDPNRPLPIKIEWLDDGPVRCYYVRNGRTFTAMSCLRTDKCASQGRLY